MSENYRIDANGKTIQEAENNLGKKKKDLTSKFHKSNVSTTLNIVDAHYKGVYKLKGKCTSDACETHFEIESQEGFEAVIAKAKKHPGAETHYDTQFSIEQYLKLSNEQKKVLNPEKKRTPAGPYAQRTSSLDQLKGLF